MSAIIAALISSQLPGEPKDRQIRVVKDTQAPIVAEGFVGLCCKSMQKMCNDLKNSLEKGRQPKLRRITKYDDEVQPRYEGFPFNA